MPGPQQEIIHELRRIRQALEKKEQPETGQNVELKEPAREPAQKQHEGQHKCETCGREFASIAGLHAHQRVHK